MISVTTPLYMQDSDQRPIIKSMSDFYVRHLYLRSMSYFKFSNWCPIIKSMAISHFRKLASNDVTDVCPNPNSYQ